MATEQPAICKSVPLVHVSVARQATNNLLPPNSADAFPSAADLAIMFTQHCTPQKALLVHAGPATSMWRSGFTTR